jgi:hypothetical protein
MCKEKTSVSRCQYVVVVRKVVVAGRGCALVVAVGSAGTVRDGGAVGTGADVVGVGASSGVRMAVKVLVDGSALGVIFANAKAVRIVVECAA